MLGWRGRYVDALCKEIQGRKDYLGGEPVDTIYIGGGTPSLLETEDFMKIHHAILLAFGTNKKREVTLEANPDDLHAERFEEIVAALPFNRLSIGIQTFDDKMLRLLNRRHTARQAIEAVKNAQATGFDNISIDLIYGLPGQTIGDLEKDIDQALALKVQHISAYSLTYEEGTPLYTMLRKQQVSEVDEDSSNLFFTLLMDKLAAAGYEHYEISNFCLPGMHSRHNSSYWEGIPYLGCGASAHSYDRKSREWNVSSVEQYVTGIEQGRRVFDREYLARDTRYNELVITSLRKRTGLPLCELEKDFGNNYLAYCLDNAQKYLACQELELTDGHLRLTRKGLFLSNGIMSDLLKV